MSGMFHAKLDVYRLAVQHAGIAFHLANSMTKGAGDLADQLRRASASVVLNIAEGAAEFSQADRNRIFRIARRSATECSSIIDVADEVGVLPHVDLSEMRAVQERLVAMLTGLARSTLSKATTDTNRKAKATTDSKAKANAKAKAKIR